jgi:uncharacterized protein (TIGR02599 family)
MLVAVAIFCAILVLVFSVITQASGVWRRSSDKIQAFQEARLAFEAMTRNLSQATLNTYLDYDNAETPTRYLRKSELKFLCGPAGASNMPGTAETGQAIFFQAPIGYNTATNYQGMASLLNTCGYFVDYDQNRAAPYFIQSANNPYRYRLMQSLVPTESNSVYAGGNTWFTSSVQAAMPIANNIIALVFRPQDPAVTNFATPPNDSYSYDSTANATADPQPVVANQLPPVIQVTMVAMDEPSASRLEAGSSPPPVIRNALTGKFTDPENYETDLQSLTQSLTDAKINYRVFSTAVPIRETKWTK